MADEFIGGGARQQDPEHTVANEADAESPDDEVQQKLPPLPTWNPNPGSAAEQVEEIEHYVGSASSVKDTVKGGLASQVPEIVSAEVPPDVWAQVQAMRALHPDAFDPLPVDPQPTRTQARVAAGVQKSFFDRAE